MLDMCKSLDLNIANDRKTGDPFGSYKCFKWNGTSVVDYFITSSLIFQNVSAFKVGEFLPWLSDHCPIYFTLELRNKIEIVNSNNKKSKEKSPKQFVWSSTGKQSF